MTVIIVTPHHITMTFVTVIHIITLFLFYWVQNKKKRRKKRDERIKKIRRT